ncbi:MAG: N-acetylmuramic acid 6-phosphate etherase [candidate division Zixibacteria bacterium]|nr:N-acetylmuramic acid 6-phosphate etherase [candidate division Zixibacteria bacterium]
MKNNSHKELIDTLSKLATEQINQNTIDIDELSPLEIVTKINTEDKKVALVVEQALPQIAKAAQIASDTLKINGRIIYIGAGTSGRLGVIDAAECPPTFGTDPKQIVGMISGGYETLILSKEGVEDNTAQAVEDLQEINLDLNDVVIGIAASGRTPYTQAGLEYAKAIGCKTVFIICNNYDDLKIKPDVLIELPVGPEVITGSTRMKSGTAQKMTLNMITTTTMVLLGKTYGNLMVDLQARSEKLAARSRKILMEFLDIDYDTADALLKSSGGSVKTAIVMYRLSVDKPTAEQKLDDADGFLKRVIK